MVSNSIVRGHDIFLTAGKSQTPLITLTSTTPNSDIDPNLKAKIVLIQIAVPEEQLKLWRCWKRRVVEGLRDERTDVELR